MTFNNETTAVPIPKCQWCGCSPPHKSPESCYAVISVEYDKNNVVVSVTFDRQGKTITRRYR